MAHPKLLMRGKETPERWCDRSCRVQASYQLRYDGGCREVVRYDVIDAVMLTR